MAFLKSRARPLAWALAAGLLATAPLAGQPVGAGESEIKAAFVYNFAKYVTWPLADHDAGAFEICALADAAFLRNLGLIVAGESIDGRPVTLRTPESPAGARTCRILYIGRDEEQRAGDLLRAVNGAPVLTVGDEPDFLARGGAVSLVRDAERVRFDVNLDEAQRAGLTISSRLLRLARRVSSGAEP